MRASSLSDPRVIELVSRYFVPVWVSRDNYQLGTRPAAEWLELRRMDRDTKQRGLKGGTVCVYIMAPDGAVLATMPVHQAVVPKNLIPMIERIIDKEKLTPRNPEAVSASAVPRKPVSPETEGGVVLHVRTKNEGPRARYGVSEDWVQLSAAEWKAFLPEKAAKAGDSRQVPDKVADKLFQYFYPPGPNWKIKDSTVLKRSLTATVVSATDKEVRVKLSGSVTLSHPFGAKDTPGKVTAKVAGVLHYDPAKKTLTSFLMASEEAQFVWLWRNRPQPEKMVIAVELEPRSE